MRLGTLSLLFATSGRSFGGFPASANLGGALTAQAGTYVWWGGVGRARWEKTSLGGGVSAVLVGGGAIATRFLGCFLEGLNPAPVFLEKVADLTQPKKKPPEKPI